MAINKILYVVLISLILNAKSIAQICDVNSAVEPEKMLEVLISIEDDLSPAGDIDFNDIETCGDYYLTEDKVSFRGVLRPRSAGSTFKNQIYLRNICNGFAIIHAQKIEATCNETDDDYQSVPPGGLIELSESFLDHAFTLIPVIL